MKAIDIKAFSNQLLDEMQTQLETIANENPDVTSRASKSLATLKVLLHKLKGFTCPYEFSAHDEEIEFFKTIKPLFTSQYYYYDKLFSLKVNEPFGDIDELRIYYHHSLDELKEFIRANQEFYRYCLSDSAHLDDRYFTREGNSSNGFDIDVRFSTGYDNMLGMIHANLRVKDYILQMFRSEFSDPAQSSLAWTGSKAALVELIYALQSGQAINNGKADIKQIACAFENLFNINLGNRYRLFQEIRLRKNGKTNFLNEIKEKLEQRMDDFG